MRTRGYPVSDFDQRAADISVHHPRVVDNYRSARDIAQRHKLGRATTEDLRRAMVYYRGLFQDLLEDHENETTQSREADVSRANAERVAERDLARDADRNAERAVERELARDADRMEIPVQRVGERLSERDIRTDREVIP